MRARSGYKKQEIEAGSAYDTNSTYPNPYGLVYSNTSSHLSGLAYGFTPGGVADDPFQSTVYGKDAYSFRSRYSFHANGSQDTNENLDPKDEEYNNEELTAKGHRWNQDFQEMIREVDEKERVRKLRLLEKDFTTFIQAQTKEIHKGMTATFSKGIAGGNKVKLGGLFWKLYDEPRHYNGLLNARKAAKLEYKGYNTILQCSIAGLHFPLYCLADYLGHRFVITSLLQFHLGIEGSNQIEEETLCNGSIDGGKKLLRQNNVDQGVQDRLKRLCSTLHLKPMKLDGLTSPFYGPVDMETHRAWDGDIYIIDAHRLLPPTTSNHTEATQLYQLFRPEFLKKLRVANNIPPLWSDAYFRANLLVPKVTPKKYRKEQAHLCLATETLMKSIPVFITEKSSEITTSEKLVELMHQEGINLRYLPLVGEALLSEDVKLDPKDRERVVDLVHLELLVRFCKRQFLLENFKVAFHRQTPQGYIELFVEVINRLKDSDADLLGDQNSALLDRAAINHGSNCPSFNCYEIDLIPDCLETVFIHRLCKLLEIRIGVEEPSFPLEVSFFNATECVVHVPKASLSPTSRREVFEDYQQVYLEKLWLEASRRSLDNRQKALQVSGLALSLRSLIFQAIEVDPSALPQYLSDAERISSSCTQFEGMLLHFSMAKGYMSLGESFKQKSEDNLQKVLIILQQLSANSTRELSSALGTTTGSESFTKERLLSALFEVCFQLFRHSREDSNTYEFSRNLSRYVVHYLQDLLQHNETAGERVTEPTIVLLTKVAAFLCEESRYDEGRSFIELACEKWPSDPKQDPSTLGYKEVVKNTIGKICGSTEFKNPKVAKSFQMAMKFFDQWRPRNPNPELLTDIFSIQAAIMRYLGHYEEALSSAFQSLAFQLPNRWVDVANGLGNVSQNIGDPENSIKWYRSCIVKGDKNSLRPLLNLGQLYLILGRNNEAEECMEEACSLTEAHEYLRVWSYDRKTWDVAGIAWSLDYLSNVRLAQLRLNEALPLAAQARSLYKFLGNKIHYWRVTMNLGLIFAARGELGRAEKLLKRSKDKVDFLCKGNRLESGHRYRALGILYLRSARYQEATAMLTYGQQDYESLSLNLLVSSCQRLLAASLRPGLQVASRLGVTKPSELKNVLQEGVYPGTDPGLDLHAELKDRKRFFSVVVGIPEAVKQQLYQDASRLVHGWPFKSFYLQNPDHYHLTLIPDIIGGLKVKSQDLTKATPPIEPIIQDVQQRFLLSVTEFKTRFPGMKMESLLVRLTKLTISKASINCEIEPCNEATQEFYNQLQGQFFKGRTLSNQSITLIRFLPNPENTSKIEKNLDRLHEEEYSYNYCFYYDVTLSFSDLILVSTDRVADLFQVITPLKFHC